MLRVGERVLLLALSDESDKHPLGYLSSKLLTDVEGRSSFVTMDCALTSFRDAPAGERSWEPVAVDDCVFRVEACVDRHDAVTAGASRRRLESSNSVSSGMQPGTPVRYSKAVQLVHEFSGALLSIDVQERAASEGFAMKVVLKTVEPPTDGGPSNEWLDTWWELRSLGSVRISQVLHYDEVCLHSNRWKRSVRARPIHGGGNKSSREELSGAGRLDTPVPGGRSREGNPGLVDASFIHSLLRVVPYDDCPSLPSSLDDPYASRRGALTAIPSNLSSSAVAGEMGRGGFGPGLNPSDGIFAPDGGVLRGGDVVRLCHLTSTGFLTHETPLKAAGGGFLGQISTLEDGGTGSANAVEGRESDGRGGGKGADSKAESDPDGSRPYLYVSNTPQRRENLQNASSNCLWVLERTHCALGGRPLRRSSTTFQQAVAPPLLASNSAGGGGRGLGSGSGAEQQRRGYFDGVGLGRMGENARGNSFSGSAGNAGGGNNGGGGAAGGFGNSGAAGSSGANVGATSSFPSGGRDTYAEVVAKRRRRQGAGDAVEYVRIKHLATMRYLCVGKKCDSFKKAEGQENPAAPRGNGSSGRGGGGKGGEKQTKATLGPTGNRRRRKKTGDNTTRVGMVTVERHAAIPAATVFVIRPRTSVGAGASTTAVAADGGLGPEDLVHLQHKDTGLFLSALLRVEGASGARVGLTMVKSPLTTEYWRLTRAPERERKATNHTLTATAQLKATLEPLVDEIEKMPLPGDEAAMIFHPPPLPPVSVLRPATLAVGHFHAVYSRLAVWWGEKKSPRANDRAASTAHPSSAAVAGGEPSAGGKGVRSIGESPFTRAMGQTDDAIGSSKKKERAGGSWGSGKGGIFSGAGGTGTAVGGNSAGPTWNSMSLDEFHVNPRLRFQLLLREQGVIVIVFDAMQKIFRAQDGILARTLWWDEDDDVVTAPDIRPAFKGNGGNGGSVGSDMGWQIRRDRSDARHSLRLFVRETMALANFFAKEHPRGKAMLEGFTPLLRELIGSGLGACELLATIRRDNPRTSVIVTAKRIQEILNTLPESRDLANSMRLLASICKMGNSLLPTIQHLVAVTVLVGNDVADDSTSNVFNSTGGNDEKENEETSRRRSKRESDGVQNPPRPAKGLAKGFFRYELIRDSSATVAGSTCSLGASSGAAETGTSTSNRGRRQSWRAPDGARGIRVRLKRLVTGASLGPHRRRMKELAGETKVSSGDGVLFEAVREDNGKASRTVVRVLNRGGAEEPPAGQGGAGASSGAGELLDFFVESVMLLSTLCRERHVRNIQLVRSLKGTSFEELMEVVRCESVPLMVRSAFAQLVLNCHLDVAPLLPRHPVRYVRLKDDDLCESSSTEASLDEAKGDEKVNESASSSPGTASVSETDEHETQRMRLRDALEFADTFLKKHARPGGTLHLERWKNRVGIKEHRWETLYVKESTGSGGSSALTSSFKGASATPQSTRGNTRRTTLLSTHDEGVQQTPQQQQQQQQQDPHTPVRSVTHRPRSLSSLSSIFADGNGHAINADAAMSTVSRPLLLTESLRLVGGVLWLLRATFILLGRRPFGRGSADDNLSQTLFRRLCSLLEFLENVRNERIKFEKYSSGSGTHGSGGAGLGGGTGGALFRPSSVGPGDGGGADYASTSRMMSSLASEYAVGVTDIQVSVMGVLTLMLGHELDGQIDKVLTLAEAYDKDGTAFSSSSEPGEKSVATFKGEDIWGEVHRSGFGLLAGKVGEETAHNLGKTLMELAVAGQERARMNGRKLTARSFALLFRISDQGNQLAREARKVILLSGHAAAETHHRLTRAVAALRAFSRRRRGRSTQNHRATGISSVPVSFRVQSNKTDPAPPSGVSSRVRSGVNLVRPSPAVWVGRDVSGNDGDGDGDGGGGGDVSRRETVQPIADASSDDGVGGGGVSDHYSLVHAPHTPLLSSSPLSHSGSTGPSEEEHPRPIGNVEGDQGDRDDSDDGHRGDRRGEIRIQSMRARSWAPAKAAANEAAAAQASAETAAAAAAAAAADASAVASAAVAEDEAALLEEDSIVEALKEVRAALAAGREDEAGAQVERVAAGVGLAPALLGALKALRRRDMTASAPGAGGVGKAGEMAADVMDLLCMLVNAGPNPNIRRLVFSNFTMLLTFLNVDTADQSSQQNVYTPTGGQYRQSDDYDDDDTGNDSGSRDWASRGISGRSGGDGVNSDDAEYGKYSDKWGRRLYFARPVARLMGAVVDGDAFLGESISEEHLKQLAMGAARTRETELLTLLQKFVTCRGTPAWNMQRRVLVALLRELSRTDFHAAFGWQYRTKESWSTSGSGFLASPPPSPPGLAPPANYGSSTSASANMSPPSVNRRRRDQHADGGIERPIYRKREVSWGGETFSGREGSGAEMGPGFGGSGDSEDIGRDAATSGLGFMSALQDALVRPREEDDDSARDGQNKDRIGARTDRHAFELLSTIAACCEGKNHFTEVQCRSMVSLEGLVNLISRGTPVEGDLPVDAANAEGEDTTPRTRLMSPPSRPSAPPTMTSPTHDMASKPDVGAARIATSAGPAAVDPTRPTISSWYKETPQAKDDDSNTPGRDQSGRGKEMNRPLPPRVRWAFMCLLDSLFFTVKEPVEGLDRHHAVHTLLENLLVTARFCTTVPATERWRNEEVDFIICTAAPCLCNFFRGCWRDPQPFVAMTARRLVSTLAVLYYTLVEDVLSIAETAGLVWKPQDGDSESKGPWTWEGESSKEDGDRLSRRKMKLIHMRGLITELYTSDLRKRDLFSRFHEERLRVQASSTGGDGIGGRGGSALVDGGLGGGGGGGGDGGGDNMGGDSGGTNDKAFNEVFSVMQKLDMIPDHCPSNPSATYQGDTTPRAAGATDPTDPSTTSSGPGARSQTEGGQNMETGLNALRALDEDPPAGFTSVDTRSTLVRSFEKSGSVRFPHRRSSGGSSGFFRDDGHGGDDNYQSVSGSLAPLAERTLPANWATGNAQVTHPPQASTAAAPTNDGPSTQATNVTGSVVRTGGGDGIGEGSSVHENAGQGRPVGLSGSSGMSLGGSFRGSRHRSGDSGERFDQIDGRGGLRLTGARGTAASSSSTMLFSSGSSTKGRSMKLLPFRREGLTAHSNSGGSGRGMNEGGDPLSLTRMLPPRGGNSSRFSSFATRSGDSRGHGLKLSEHARTRWFRRLPATNVSDTDLDENRRNIGQILPLLEASVAGNGEVEALVANLQKVSRDNHVRALIAYVCSPALPQGTAGTTASSDMKSSPDSDPEMGLKRFGLQLLRFVIVTALPKGDGADGLPGMWQAGGRAERGVSTNEMTAGRMLDEKAIRLHRERAGRQEQQERIASLGGGSTILLFVGGLTSSTIRETASDAFQLAKEMLQGGNKKVQEHFFAVLRDSREDEKFFAVVTSFIRASVARLADRQRRGVVQRKFKRAEREVHKLAAEGNRQSAGKRSRLRLWTRTTGGVGATVGAGDGRGRAKGMTRVLRGGDLFNTHAGAKSSSDSDESTGPPTRGIRRGEGRLGGSFPGYRRRAMTDPVLSEIATTGAAPGSERRTANAAIANMSITVVEPGGGVGGGGIAADGGQGDDNGAPAALPAAASSSARHDDLMAELSTLSGLMDFLRLLCENHYSEMQEYMRMQPDNMRSYNMVVEVAGMLQGLEWVTLEDSKHWGIDATTIDLAFTVVRTLVEFAQGNEGNKLTIATPSLSSSINDLFVSTFGGGEGPESVEAAYQRDECKVSPAQLKHQAFVLLYSLIEGCHEPSVFSTLMQTLDFEAILGVLQGSREALIVATKDYRTKERKYLKLRRAKWRAGVCLVFQGWRRALTKATQECNTSKEKWRSARRGYSTPVLFLRALLDGNREEHPKLCSKEEARFQNYLNEWDGQIRNIEIKREGRLERMYFVVPNWCLAQWSKTPVAEMREQMKKKCARATSSPGWKLLKFYQHGEGMLSQMAYLDTLKATSLHLITVHEVKWSVLSFVLALSINVLDILSSARGWSDSLDIVIGAVIGAVHLVVSCLRLVAFMYNRQQKWLIEERLPALTLVRRVLRLGPRRTGEAAVRPAASLNSPSPALNHSQTRRASKLGGLAPAMNMSMSGRQGGKIDVFAGVGSAFEGSRGVANTGSISSLQIGGPKKMRRFRSSDSDNKTSSYASSADSGSDTDDSEEEEQRGVGRGGHGRSGRHWNVGGRGKEVSRVDRLTRVAVMLRCSKWNALYVAVSLAGLVLSACDETKSRSACYAFCLLDVSVRYRAMHRVLRAVSKNWAMLWQTAMLVVVVLFLFAAVGTAWFSDDFALGEAVEAVKDKDAQIGGCDTLGQCSATLFQYALRGDLGSYLYLPSHDAGAGSRLARFIFDVSYWVLVPLLLLNMVSGVILDSFAQLRDEETNLKAELKSRCVVCGIWRHAFDRGGNVFYDHITHDHCMWNYVLVRAYLNDKPELEHTGQESYVHALQRGGADGTPRVSYFPIGEAGALEERDREEDLSGGSLRRRRRGRTGGRTGHYDDGDGRSHEGGGLADEAW